MARSSANLVSMPPKMKATKEMEVCYGIPYWFFPVSYGLDMAAEQYRDTHEFLRPNTSAAYDLTMDRQAAEKAVEHTVKKLGKLSLILGSFIAVRPFSLAKALGKYDFTAHRVFAQKVIPSDRGASEWVTEHMPAVEVLQLEHNDIIEFDRYFPDSPSIDANTAYASGSEHVVDLFTDEGLFECCDIRKLMELVEEAADTVIDLCVLIEDYGSAV